MSLSSLFLLPTAASALSSFKVSCKRCLNAAHLHQKRAASCSIYSATSGRAHRQHYHSSSHASSSTTQTFITRKGKVKIDLGNRQLIGVHQSRGERTYQEDAFSIHSVDLPGDECRRSLNGHSSRSPSPSMPKKHEVSGSSIADGSSGETSSPSTSESANNTDTSSQDTEQALYCAVFDGHNGAQVSILLSSHLHERLLSVSQSEANSIVCSYRTLGGYMRRYKGGLLAPLVDPPAPRRTKTIARELKVEEERRARQDRGEVEPEEEEKQAVEESTDGAKQMRKDQPPWNVLQRIEAAFLKTDLEIIDNDKEAGSTSTVAILHSLDEPRNPFFGSDELHLILAHCGDTRALLCTVPDGNAVRLTETHHPEARSETDRLMRIRTGAVTDSFGETRWGGSLANTRAFGDAHYKALGVFSEPQLLSQRISGPDHAFLILLSDGVTEVLSDQEICDLASRGGFTNPTHAARNVISFAESVGAQDNLTCLIVPLAGWGKVSGEDSTKKRRDLRRQNYEGRSNRQNRM